MDFLDDVKFDARGLVPVIAQDADDGKVLMLAWADRVALEETVRTGVATYFSRSRNKLWRKGEESGNRQLIRQIRLDCDGDAVIYSVTQIGGIACHTGRRSCFYKVLKDQEWQIDEPVLKDPAQMYGKAEHAKS